MFTFFHSGNIRDYTAEHTSLNLSRSDTKLEIIQLNTQHSTSTALIPYQRAEQRLKHLTQNTLGTSELRSGLTQTLLGLPHSSPEYWAFLTAHLSEPTTGWAHSAQLYEHTAPPHAATRTAPNSMSTQLEHTAPPHAQLHHSNTTGPLTSSALSAPGLHTLTLNALFF